MQYKSEVLWTTNAICVALCWSFAPWDWPAVLGLAGLIFTTVYQIGQYLLAKRRYDQSRQLSEQAMKRYLDAGGTVMLVRYGRHWVPIPLPPRPPTL